MAERVLVIGTFDTKGPEFAFLRERILSHGCDVLTMNTGVNGSTDLFPVDIEADEVASAGGEPIVELQRKNDRGHAIVIMGQGAGELVKSLHAENSIDAVIGMGGSGGTGIVTAAMRMLPFGVPKVCVSTLASGDVSGYVAEKDIVMMPAVADIAGINRISRIVIAQAAAAVCGMVQAEVFDDDSDRPLVAASMFGNTTQCVDHCRKLLEESGYETLVFHATGSGGRVLESLAADRVVDAVLDITTTEWADELCGGVLTAGPDRLSGAARAGIPQLIVPGCLDMCNFGAMKTVPERYRTANRLFYEWTPEITLMRTNIEENRQLGRIFAEKANQASGPVAFLIPLNGFSMLDGDGELFCDRDADAAFTQELKSHLKEGIPVTEVSANINDKVFAKHAVEILLSMVKEKS